MGLDVYLYRNSRPIAEIKELEKEAERRLNLEVEKIGGWDNVNSGDNSYGAVKARAYTGLEVDENGSSNHQTRIDEPSARYPDHLFRIGYFRSSYNAGGINHILREAGQQDLYELFDLEGDDYALDGDDYEPTDINWKAARDRVAKTLAIMRGKSKLRRVMTISHNPFSGITPTDAAQALAQVNEELDTKEHAFDDGGWMSSKGHFWPEGFKIVAAVPGVEENIISTLVGGGDKKSVAVHLIYEQEAEDLASYVQSLEIVLETIDHVLENGPENFSMTWSG